jgi:plastocyanin
MRHIVAAGTALACLALVGCGKDGGSSTGPEASNGATTPAASAPVALSGTVNDHGTKDLAGKDELELEQDDFYFGPTYIKAAPGAQVKVKLANEGSTAHTFTIDALHVDQTLKAGEHRDVTVTLPATGAVAFYCRFHKGQGMQGAIYVNAGDTVVPGGAPSSSSGDGGAYGQ